MTVKFRTFPSTWGSVQIINGTTYNQSPGTVLDAPYADLTGLIGFTPLCMSGPTSGRPPASAQSSAITASPGTIYLDTTLGKIIAFDGQTWRDPVTMNAV